MGGGYGDAMTIHASSDTSSAGPAEQTPITWNIDRAVAEIGVRLLDDAYMAWLVAESESEEALASWLAPFSARPRAAAYRSYLAAVDREQAAARDLERLREITAPCLALLGEDAPAIA